MVTDFVAARRSLRRRGRQHIARPRTRPRELRALEGIGVRRRVDQAQRSKAQRSNAQRSKAQRSNAPRSNAPRSKAPRSDAEG
jgi:hypothetical protein